MATITGYNSLLSACQSVAEDDGVEFMQFAPVAIDLAEERLFKDLDLLDLEGKVIDQLVAGAATVGKPTGYKFANHFVISTQNQFNVAFSSEFSKKPNSKRILKKREEDYLIDYWPSQDQLGTPKYYSDTSSALFTVAPTPDTSYIYEIKYTAQPTKLSASNDSNYFTQQCKDIIYFATMVEMAKFMKAWSQVQSWEAEYSKAKEAWNVQEMRRRRDNGEIPLNNISVPNTIMHTASSKS